jgi:hypothetical protein
MPLFSSSSGVEINGGNIYDIAGNMNIERGTNSGVHDSQLPTALESRLIENRERQLAAEKIGQRRGRARMAPQCTCQACFD